MSTLRRTLFARTLVLIVLIGAAVVSGCGGGPGQAAAPDGAAASSGLARESTPAPDGSRARAPIIEASANVDAPTRILDPRADEVLRAMATLLSATKTFAFEAEERFDEIPSASLAR